LHLHSEVMKKSFFLYKCGISWNQNPSKIRNQSAAAFCRGPQHGLAGCAEDISDSEHGETGHGQLILWDEDPIFVTQFLWLKHINFQKVHSCGENPMVHPHIFGWHTSIAKSVESF
jgi:hypothetical protein